ncbi:MAG: PIN domain-containing protein [Nitrospiraceae bacterium]
MRVLLDTDVVLDFLLARQPFDAAARAIWQAHEQGQCMAHVSAITPVNVFYIARRLVGIGDAQRLLSILLLALPICPVDTGVLTAAQQFGFSDFEDAVQLAAAQAAGLGALVTRNIGDYRGARLSVLTPTDFLTRL